MKDESDEADQGHELPLSQSDRLLKVRDLRGDEAVSLPAGRLQVFVDARWNGRAGLQSQLGLVVEQRVRLLLCKHQIPQLQAEEAREENHGNQAHVPGGDPDQCQVRLVANVRLPPAFVDHLQLRQVLKEDAAVVRKLPLVCYDAGLQPTDSKFAHLSVEVVQCGTVYDLKLRLDHIVQLLAQLAAQLLSLLVLMCGHLQGEDIVCTRAFP